jgi:hypothetical protein
VQEDNARLQREKQAQEAKTHKSIAKVAAIQDKIAVEEKNVTAARKPRPRPVSRVAIAAENGLPASQAKATAPRRDMAAMQEALDEVGDSGEAMQKKRKQVQKTTHRDAVDVIRATAVSGDLQDRDLDNSGITVALSSCASDADPKGIAGMYVS